VRDKMMNKVLFDNEGQPLKEVKVEVKEEVKEDKITLIKKKKK
jgi:hypothetical protein